MIGGSALAAVGWRAGITVVGYLWARRPLTRHARTIWSVLAATVLAASFIPIFLEQLPWTAAHAAAPHPIPQPLSCHPRIVHQPEKE